MNNYDRKKLTEAHLEASVAHVELHAQDCGAYHVGAGAGDLDLTRSSYFLFGNNFTTFSPTLLQIPGQPEGVLGDVLQLRDGSIATSVLDRYSANGWLPTHIVQFGNLTEEAKDTTRHITLRKGQLKFKNRDKLSKPNRNSLRWKIDHVAIKHCHHVEWFEAILEHGDYKEVMPLMVGTIKNSVHMECNDIKVLVQNAIQQFGFGILKQTFSLATDEFGLVFFPAESYHPNQPLTEGAIYTDEFGKKWTVYNNHYEINSATTGVEFVRMYRKIRTWSGWPV